MLEAAPKMKCCYRSCLRRVSLNQLQAETAAVFAEVKAAAAADEVTMDGAHISHRLLRCRSAAAGLCPAAAAAAPRPGVIVAIISVLLAGTPALVAAAVLAGRRMSLKLML
jgi:hypothetical protein